MTTPKEWSTRYLCGLVLVSFCFYLAVASFTSLWDRDEPRFARAAVEMLETGDYLVPTFNGELRADKPPLIYWCMNPWIRGWGATDLAVRMPSILGSLVMALATFHIGRNLGGSRLGCRSLWLLMCMPIPIFIGTAATADGILMAGVSVSLAVMVDRLVNGRKSSHFAILSLALAWALLAKGPVGLGAFWLGTAFIALMGKTGVRWDRRWWWEASGATVIALACFLAWGIPANQQTGGELLQIGLGRHVLQRISEPLESHGASGIIGWLVSLPFYLPVLLVGAAPISALLIPGLFQRSPDGNDDRKTRVILAGLTLPVLLLMTLVATKLPHYILSAFPGVAVAGGWLWSSFGERSSSVWNSLSFRVGRALTVLMLLLLVIAWGVAVFQISASILIAIPAQLLFLAAIWSIFQWNHQSTFESLRAPGGSALLVALGMAFLLLGAGWLEPQCKVARPIKEMIEASGSQGSKAPVSTVGFFEPSLLYALEAPAIPGQPGLTELAWESVEPWMNQEGSAWLISAVEKDGPDPVFDLLQNQTRVTKSWEKRIFNYSNGRWLDVSLWFRSIPR